MALVKIAERWTSYFVSGTETASSPDYRTHYFIYYDNSQDIANNRTRIKIDYYLKMVGTRTPTDMSSGVYINGSSTNNYISIPQKSYSTGTYYLGSKEWYIYHDSSGNGSFTFRGILYGGGKWTNRYTTGTTTYTLPTIPRYTSITNFYTQNITLTSFSFVVTASDAIDYVQHSLNGGAWTDSGNQVISGLQPGTQYSLRTRVRRTSSGLWTESGTIYATTSDIAKLVSVPNNIDIDQAIAITFNRNGATTTALGIYNTGGTVAFAPYRTVTGTSYSFELTTEEKNAFFNDMSTVNSKSYNIFLNTNNNAYRTYATRTFIITNANPTFSSFEYEDTGGDTLIPEVKTTDLTGNNQTIIKGYSNLRARISSANKMIANKGANPIEYQLVVVGAKPIKENYSASANVDLILNAIDNNVFIVYAIDSRGNSTPVQKSPSTYIDYFKPVIASLGYEREEDIGTKTTLKFNGTFFNESFGSQTNTISATYKYKRTNSDIWIPGVTPLVLTPSGNNFTCNQLIAGDLGANGFNAENSYDLEITITDKLDIASTQLVIDSGKPNMSFAKDGIAINQLYDEFAGSGLQVSGNKIMFNGITLFEWVE